MGIRQIDVSVGVIVIAVTRHSLGPVALGVVVFVVPKDIPERKIVLVRQMVIEFECLLPRLANVNNVGVIVVGVGKDIGRRLIG